MAYNNFQSRRFLRKSFFYFFIPLFFFSCKNIEYNRDNPLMIDARIKLTEVQSLMISNAGEAELIIDSLLLFAKEHKDDSLYAASLLSKGQNSIYLGDFLKFDSCLNEVLKIDFRGNELLQAETYVSLAEQSNYLGNYEDALRDVEIADNLLSDYYEEDLYLLKYKIALIKGLSYFSINKKDSMQFFMNQALNLAEKLEKKSSVLFVYSYLGYMYTELAEFENAEKYLLQAYDIADTIGNNEAKSASLISLAATYIGLGEYEKAVVKSNMALAIENEYMNADGKLSYIYNHRSEALLHLNEIQNAISDAHQAVKYSEELLDHVQIMTAYVNLANGYIKMHNWYLAKQYLDEAIDCLDTSNADLKTKEKIYSTYVNVCNETEDLKNALKYSQLTAYTRDSINMTERFNMITELEVAYETDKKEQELRLANQTIKTHYQLFLFLTLLFILILISALIFHYYYRKQRKTELELLRRSEAAAQAKLKMISHYKAVEEIIIVHDSDNTESDIDKQITNTNVNGTTLSTDRIEEIIKEVNSHFKVHKVHLDSSLTLAVFAEIIGTNTTYLSTVLNQALNTNFTSLLNFYRIEEAKHIFKLQANYSSTKIDNLDTIAANCGFRSVSVFHVNFKKETGMTPGQYKKSLIGEN